MSFSWHKELLERTAPAWTVLKDGVKNRELDLGL